MTSRRLLRSSYPPTSSTPPTFPSPFYNHSVHFSRSFRFFVGFSVLLNRVQQTSVLFPGPLYFRSLYVRRLFSNSSFSFFARTCLFTLSLTKSPTGPYPFLPYSIFTVHRLNLIELLPLLPDVL